MPSYGSLHSPSLRKMENSRVQYGSGRKRVSIGNIIGDPFALATISIAAVRITPILPVATMKFMLTIFDLARMDHCLLRLHIRSSSDKERLPDIFVVGCGLLLFCHCRCLRRRRFRCHPDLPCGHGGLSCCWSHSHDFVGQCPGLFQQRR